MRDLDSEVWRTVVWHKATRSGANGDCVEVANIPGTVGVRDSKDSAGLMIGFTPDAWQRFITAVRDGDLTR